MQLFIACKLAQSTPTTIVLPEIADTRNISQIIRDKYGDSLLGQRFYAIALFTGWRNASYKNRS
jgi:hypothetical protein